MGARTGRMTRQREVIETVYCDICGKQTDDPVTVTLGWDGDKWTLDLCASDYERVATQFDRWIADVPKAGAKRSAAKKTAKSSSEDWEYLESLGFSRHRGRKSAEEHAALAAR